MTSTRRPSLESLRIFEACARLGGFTRAANALGLSQSAVSLRMRDLQADMSVRLFASTRPRLALSVEGRRLAAALARAFATVDAALDELSPAPKTLRVSVNPTFVSRWLTRRMHTFAAVSEVAAIELDVTAELRPLTQGGADLAIRSGRGAWPGLHAELLMPIDRTPMMSPTLAAHLDADPAPQAVLNLPLFSSENWPAWFEKAGVFAAEPKFRSEVYPTQDLLAKAAQNGAGVALLSPCLFETELRQGLLVAPWPITLVGPDGHYAVYAPARLPAAARRFIDWIAGEIAASNAARV